MAAIPPYREDPPVGTGGIVPPAGDERDAPPPKEAPATPAEQGPPLPSDWSPVTPADAAESGPPPR
jgi:hypothetical protein